jgi:serine/threonine protein kinase
MTKHLESARTMMIGTPDYMARAARAARAAARAQQRRADAAPNAAPAPLRSQAPELLTHNLARGDCGAGEYDARAIDVWSMGALLYICVAGVFPFENPLRPNDMTATLENVRSARYRPLPPDTSHELSGAHEARMQGAGCGMRELTHCARCNPTAPPAHRLNQPHAAAQARQPHHA